MCIDCRLLCRLRKSTTGDNYMRRRRNITVMAGRRIRSVTRKKSLEALVRQRLRLILGEGPCIERGGVPLAVDLACRGQRGHWCNACTAGGSLSLVIFFTPEG